MLNLILSIWMMLAVGGLGFIILGFTGKGIDENYDFCYMIGITLIAFPFIPLIIYLFMRDKNGTRNN